MARQIKLRYTGNMNTLIHADIFFFVTTIVFVVIGILIAIALAFLIYILKDMKEMSRIIRREGTEIAEDMDMVRQELRQAVRAGSSNFGAFIAFLGSFMRYRKSRKTKVQEEE